MYRLIGSNDLNFRVSQTNAISEQLEKDNNLDKNVVPIEYKDDAPQSWDDVKSLWKTTLHPELHPLDVRGAEHLADVAASELAQNTAKDKK